VERGIVLGGTTGLLAGLVGLRFAGFAIAGGSVLGILMASATIASLAAGLIGMSLGNSRLKKFEEEIEQGKLLVLLDVPKEQIENIRRLVIKHHPEAEFEGIEPILPPS
jgi:alanine dehydrogenase